MLMKFLAGFSDRALVSEPENSSGRTITKSTSTPASLQAIVRVHGGNNSSLHQKVNIPNEGNTRVEFFNRSDADVTQRLKTARLILSRSPAFIDCVRFPRCCYVTVERMEKEEKERREEIQELRVDRFRKARGEIRRPDCKASLVDTFAETFEADTV